MKIIKKNIYLIAILSCVVGLSACSQDDALTSADGAPDNGNAIRFTTAIADFTGSDAADNPGTRATITDEDGTGSFTNGDETTIMGTVYEAMPMVKKEHPATYKDGTWTTDMTWNEFDEGAQVSFSAFFPKRSLADFDDGKMEINLPTDQSTAEQYAACDWLHALANGRKTDNPIQLTFRHRMHRLTVNLSLSSNPGTLTQADVNAATVVIKNMETKGVVSFSGGVVPQAGNTGDFTPLKSASGNSFRVLLLPQDVTPGTPWIEITVGGKAVTYPVPAGLTGLNEGEEQVVNLALTDSGGGQPTYSTYLAGWYRNDNYDMFAYTLVNGAYTALTLPAGGFNASPNAMTVSGGKTYVVGSYFGSDGSARACYWVDGTVTKLDVPGRADPSEPDYAESIVVSGGSTYISGSYFDSYSLAPCYWVDGTLTTLTLPGGASDGDAKSIAVSDGKIYVAGYHMNSSGTKTPGYWLDGNFEPLALPDEAVFKNGEKMNIIVAGNNVYVMGTYTLNSKNYPCVWADGTRTDLTFDVSAALGAVGQSMTVAGGKVYVSGYSIPENKNNHKGCYWVDGVRTDLSAPDGAWSEAASIGVVGGKVYVGGTHYATLGDNRPCYWLDGVRTDLDIPTGGTSADIRAMYLSE